MALLDAALPMRLRTEFSNLRLPLRLHAKIEQRAPEVEIQTEKRETPKVVNIMDALKKSKPRLALSGRRASPL